MGAWGTEIMASDNALDALDSIRELVRGKWDVIDDDYFVDLTRDELNIHMRDILENVDGTYGDDFWNVLAYQIVTTGADMPTEVRKRIPSTTIEDVSVWTNPQERKDRLQELRDACDKYENGIPVEISKDGGLFSKIYKGM